MKRSTDPKKFLTVEESQKLADAVEQAEKHTSGEIKVVLTRHCWVDIHEKAAQTFKKFNLENTAQRNCVMIMLVLTNREFLIWGDEGIHERVGQEFWEDVRDVMRAKFAKGEFGEGLCEGVNRIAEKLSAFFPLGADDKDEISDEVAYED